jgi:hypothetical protein
MFINLAAITETVELKISASAFPDDSHPAHRSA